MGTDMGMKIENGKRYVSRDGEVFGPMLKHLVGWTIAGCAHGWRSDGRYCGYLDSRMDLISEYIEPPAETAPDMTQNRVPWWLLTDEERAALENHSGPIEWWTGPGYKWAPCNWGDDGFNEEGIYRTVDPPVITEERQDISTAAGRLVTVTLTLHDGKPISGTVAV